MKKWKITENQNAAERIVVPKKRILITWVNKKKSSSTKEVNNKAEEHYIIASFKVLIFGIFRWIK